MPLIDSHSECIIISSHTHVKAAVLFLFPPFMPHENCFVPFGERIFPRVVDENKFLFLVVVTLACLHLSLTHIFKFKMNDTLGRSKVIPVIESYEFETENISLFVPDRDFSIQLSSVNFS